MQNRSNDYEASNASNNDEMVAVLRNILEVTRTKRDIYMNGRVVAEEVTREQRSMTRQSGKTLLPIRAVAPTLNKLNIVIN